MTETMVATGLTVKDIYEQYEGNLVLVERHGDYFPTPEEQAQGNERYARVYTREYPDCLCSLNEKGIETSRQQGIALAKLGMVPDSIQVSPLARGAQTGLWIQRGLIEAGAFARVKIDDRLAYPQYHKRCQKTKKKLSQIMDEIGDPFPTLIMRGKLDLWADYDDRTMFEFQMHSVLNWLFDLGGFRIACAHWENLVILRLAFTCPEYQDIPHDDFLAHPSGMYQWTPTKNGGLIFGGGDGLEFLGEYDPEFRVTPYQSG